jgi:2-polyprenyl-3-methyl-5-hydroxy-6-metoxy-1,4-benzoquinol methylase
MMISDDWNRRNCPLCDSLEISNKPEIQSASPAESLSYDEVGKAFVGLRKKQIFFSYYRCLNCQLLYCPWYFNQHQLDELYKVMPDNLMGEEEGISSKTQSGYSAHIAKFIKEPINILELGPDIGLLGKSLADRANIRNITFVEPNEAVYGELKKNSEKFSNVKIVDTLQAVAESLKFDLTIGIHVFDHLLNPKISLESLAFRSQPLGCISLVVHNEKSTLRRILKSKWPPFCLQHPQLFNRDSLDTMLKKTGWSVISTARTTNHYSFRNLAALAFKVIGFGSGKENLIPNFHIAIKLGNIICVAQKNDSDLKV